MRLRIIKVGGSLFQYDGLVPALRDWLSLQPPARNLLIPGGGSLVDTVRDLDQRYGLEPPAAHWLSIRLLDVTARLLHLLLPEAEFTDRWDDLRHRLSTDAEALLVFSVEEFLQLHERDLPGRKLRPDWSTTSDSIAARVAEVLGAEQLVLLKSADVPCQAGREQLAADRYVDTHFPAAARGLPVSCVNLRTGKTWSI